MNGSIWYNNPRLASFEKQREYKRKRSRTTFDCFHLKVQKDDRAFCSKGRHLGRALDGTLPLETVLRGSLFAACKSCLDFDS